jgi:hypothetical protein
MNLTKGVQSYVVELLNDHSSPFSLSRFVIDFALGQGGAHV